MEESKKNSNNKILIIVLTILLFLLIGYTFYQSRDHEEAMKLFQDEKEQIIANLTAMEEKYDVAISQNTTLSDSLMLEKERIIALKDSVSNLKRINSSIIRRYRSRIKKLEMVNERLLDQVDSLRMVSNVLIDEKDSISNQLQIQTTYNDTLRAKNEELAKKVEIGSVLTIKDVKVKAMKLRSNGKYTQTNKAQKTDAISLEFKIAENEIASPGERQIIVVIKDPKGSVINAKGVVSVEDGQEIKYTEETSVNFENAEIDVVLFVNTKGVKFEKGEYEIDIYVEGRLVGVSKLELADSFLGL